MLPVRHAGMTRPTDPHLEALRAAANPLRLFLTAAREPFDVVFEKAVNAVVDSASHGYLTEEESEQLLRQLFGAYVQTQIHDAVYEYLSPLRKRYPSHQNMQWRRAGGRQSNVAKILQGSRA